MNCLIFGTQTPFKPPKGYFEWCWRISKSLWGSSDLDWVKPCEACHKPTTNQSNDHPALVVNRLTTSCIITFIITYNLGDNSTIIIINIDFILSMAHVRRKISPCLAACSQQCSCHWMQIYAVLWCLQSLQSTLHFQEPNASHENRMQMFQPCTPRLPWIEQHWSARHRRYGFL